MLKYVPIMRLFTWTTTPEQPSRCYGVLLQVENNHVYGEFVDRRFRWLLLNHSLKFINDDIARRATFHFFRIFCARWIIFILFFKRAIFYECPNFFILFHIWYYPHSLIFLGYSLSWLLYCYWWPLGCLRLLIQLGQLN